jgi:hypothetical protein
MIKRILVPVVTAFMALVLLATTALANDSVCSRVFNKTANNIQVEFHTSDGHWVYQTLAPGTWQGEISGNKYYEPRYVVLTARRCIEYHISYWDHYSNTTKQCAGTDTTKKYYISVYFGDGYSAGNYDFVLTRLTTF